MDRITGSDALGMMEAYNAVYAPQELTEEQVWEEVEVWVNSLVEEGYDLSEFTWEDMYEYYLNEGGAGPRATTAGPTMYGPNDPRRTQSGPYQSRFPGRPILRSLNTSDRKPPIGSLPSSAKQIMQYPQGVPTGTVGGGNAGASIQPPARPVAQAPARPAAPAPAARPTPAPAGTSRPNAPTRPATPSYSGATGVTAQNAPVAAPARTFNPLMQRTFGYQTGYAPSQVKGDIRKMAVMGSLRNSFDPFDIVMGYLIDEGYAENEEEATVIMTNMSEEWREEILDEALTGNRGKRAIKKFQDQNDRPNWYKKPGESKNPSPNYTLGAVARHKEGSPNRYNPATPEDYADSGNRPTKRGGRGEKGEPKTGYYGTDRRDSDRGRGNAARRRMENK
jgi:hypothetical protein